MKLVYKGEKDFLILHPENHYVTKGYEIETDDEQFIKDLKELGFQEVKQGKKKEGDK
jgi:hypothetical protein